MIVYLAARFSRIKELRGYRVELEQLGITVTSRWLDGGHEWSGTDDDALPVDVGARFAREDLEDVDAAHVLVAFTEAPRSGPSRGGRHTEFGYALARNKLIIAVGPAENVFYCLPEVYREPDWAGARWLLQRWQTKREIGGTP